MPFELPTRLALSIVSLVCLCCSMGQALEPKQNDDGPHAVNVTPAPDINAADWKPIFNGKDLTGWVQRYGTATFVVRDQCIVGQTAVGSPDSFLCTESEYTDFELTLEVKMDPELNSGIQIRSASRTDVNHGRVYGPQIEIEANNDDLNSPCETGYIYSEGTGRGWLSQNRVGVNLFDNNEWNRLVVRVRGPRIQTWVNGRKVEDLRDDKLPESGFIGLQVHSIPKGTGPFKVQCRDIRIRKLTEPQK